MTKMPKEKQQPPPSSLGQSLSTKSLAKSETIGTKQKKKQPPPSSLGPSLLTKPLSNSETTGTKKKEKQPPTSPLGPSLSTKPLAKSKTIGTKQKEKKPPPPQPDSPSEPSSNGEEFPAPSYSLERPTGASTAADLPKHPIPSSDSTDGEIEEEDESSENDHESKEEEPQMEKKQPSLLFPPSSNTNKKQEKQPPLSSVVPSLSTKSSAKSEKTGTKKKEKQPPPLPVSPSTSSSSNGEESPPSYPLEKAIGASTTAVLPKHSEPSQVSADSEVEEEENGSGSDHEAMEEESSDDFAAVEAKPNPPVQMQDSGEGKGQQALRSTSSSGSGSEDGEEEEKEEEVGSSSESDQAAPPHKQAENIVMKTEVPIAENVSDSSSDSDQAKSPHRSSIRAAVPLSSKPMDCPAQPSGNIGIIANPFISGFKKKKRKRVNEIIEEAGQENKSPIKRIWSDEDELSLLQGVLDYKERYHIVPSNLVQLEPLYDSIKGLISTPVTSNQMFEKVGRIRRNYIKRANKLNESLWTRSLNGHSAAVFNIAAKIWGEKIKGDITNLKEKQKDVGEKGKHARYPSLLRFIKYEHTYSPWALQLSHISNTKLNNLDKKCEKLEITEVRLHVKKQELFSAAMELIDGALAKCE